MHLAEAGSGNYVKCHKSFLEAECHAPSTMGILEYMSTKWFSKFERQSDNLLMSSVKGPYSFQWRDIQFPASSDVKLCVEQLQHSKASLLAEMKGSALSNLSTRPKH
jgi:hypothetical protein